MAKRDYYIFNLNSNTKAIGQYGKLTLDDSTATSGHINFNAQNVVTAYTTNNWAIDNGYGSTTLFPEFQFEAPSTGLAGLTSIVVIKSNEYTTDLTFPNSGSYIDMCNEAVADHAPSGSIAFDYTNFTNNNSYYSSTWYSQGYFASSISLTSGYENNELDDQWVVNWGTSSAGNSSSGNEYFTDDTFGTTFQYNSPKTFDAADFDSKVQGTFGGSAFVNQGRSIDISNITNTDSEKITALLKAIDIQTYRTFKKEL